MLTASQRILLGGTALAFSLAFGSGCGGGGSTASGSSATFKVLTISVTNNGTWQINRPIEFTFSQDVDFSSVNLNTINIAQPNGTPASGEFTLKNPHTVVFQPACPTRSDYLDAGLLPNGQAYSINVLGSSQGGPTVLSSTGRSLTSSQTVTFHTPVSADNNPTVLFLDPQLGPPAAIVRADTSTLAASYLEIGGDSSVGARVYFSPRTVADPNLGADVPASFKAPLNEYSAPSTALSIVLALNQPVNPSAANITSDNIDLQYQIDATTWQSFAHSVQLVANCTGTGALVRVTPTGILPQGRQVRVSLGSNFSDLVGERNIVPIVVGSFQVGVATDPGTTTPGDGADTIREDFTVSGSQPGSQEDTTSVLTITSGPTTTTAPRAIWSSNGKLTASFAFDGTGGTGGDFHWVIGNGDSVQDTVILDTSFSVITNQDNSLNQSVVNGRVDIGSLWVMSDGLLLIRGPNPCTILCSGKISDALPVSVLVQGRIKCNGSSNIGVNSFGTQNIPEVGAPGVCGGGRGGTGSFLTTQSTPQGGPGFGAFGVAGAGGQGGETGFNVSSNVNLRRPGGGGGGVFGRDQVERTRFALGCPDQRVIGMDAERGFNGETTANGALGGIGSVAQGGAKGTSPFVDSSATNDFWGTMIAGGTVILGELTHPWAGAGGGGGGNSCQTSAFPTTPFVSGIGGDQKGAGGGGGGGSLTILALGDIRIGSIGGSSTRARIEVNGGTGGGGENTNNLDRIGGGSGGGSGGHLILQSSSQIDLTGLSSTSATVGTEQIWGGLFAKGGQGGAGSTDQGGAQAGGRETSPALDALAALVGPSSSLASYPAATAPCGVNGTGDYGPAPIIPQFIITNTIGNTLPGNPKVGAGGDGGPGIIQFHTPTLNDIKVQSFQPSTLFRDICFPLPIGATPLNAQTPNSWNQLLPTFGRLSVARSKWIPLGAASVSPTSSSPDQVRFQFAGTDTTTGVVQRDLSGPSPTVLQLAPILSGALTASGTPSVTGDKRSVIFDGSLLADDIYKRNALLMKGFALKFTTLAGSVVTSFEVGSATYDATLGQLRVTVVNSGLPLASFVPGDTVQLIPRFIRVITQGVADAYPTSTEVKIKFQAAPANSLGVPDESMASAFVTNIALLNTNPNYRFIRFQVEFDIQADTVGALTPTAPIPAVDFLSIPFRF